MYTSRKKENLKKNKEKAGIKNPLSKTNLKKSPFLTMSMRQIYVFLKKISEDNSEQFYHKINIT